MNETASFFISDEDSTPDEPDTPQYTRQIFVMPETPSTRPKISSKFIKKWSEYADDTAVTKSVSAINGDLSFSLPIVKVSLTTLLKIDIDLVYMISQNGIEFDKPLTKQFISIDHQKSVFRNDAIFYLNSMGSKMTLESVGSNRFKMLEDIKGEVDVTYYPDQEYFVVESELEKFIYGKFGDTGTILNELSYRHWRETGDDPKSLIQIPVAWYLAERHSKSDGRSLYYRYETVDVPHALNQNVSYTSEVMLKSIDDGGNVKVEFGYGLKESSENKELKLKTDDGNLRMGNFLVDKHFLDRIQVETEHYTQDFGLTYDLFEGKIRVPKAITQVMSDGNSEEVLSLTNQKLFGKYLPSEIGVYHGVTTKFTYDNQVVPSPLLEKKFLLKNRPVVSYGTDTLSFSSIIDNRVVLKIFDIKTFKVIKEFSIVDQKTIDETSLQVNFSQNFLVVTYKTDDGHHLKIYHQKDQQKWHENPTTFKYRKDSEIHTTGRDFIVVHDGLTLIVLQKIWNEKNWLKFDFETGDEKMKTFIRGKSIFLRERSNLHVVFKTDNGKWNFKLLKSGVGQNADRIANLFDVTDEIREHIRKPFELNEIKVVNNVVILLSLNIVASGHLRSTIKFLTVGDGYEVTKEEEFHEDREKITDLEKRNDSAGTTMVIKYRVSGGKYVLRIVEMYGKIDEQIEKEVGRNENRKRTRKQQVINQYNSDDVFVKSMRNVFLLDWNKYFPLIENGKNDLFFSKDIHFRMTGTNWTKGSIDTKRDVKLGEHFTLNFDAEHPEIVNLVSQKDQNFKIEMKLFQQNRMLNLYPYYIAYQTDKRVSKLIVFDEGKSVIRHEMFKKEELMYESNPGYLLTIKKSEDFSHSEPYELIIRNIAQFLPEKPQAVVTMTEMWKNFENWPQPAIGSLDSSSNQQRSTRDIQSNLKNQIPSNVTQKSSQRLPRSTNPAPQIRITKYDRIFKVDKKLWTANVKTMNGQSTQENGWVEYFVSRNDEADIQQVTSYYDSDKKLLKSEIKKDEKQEDQDYSDNLLYDVSGTLQISNFIPYEKSDDSFGYFGFEDYEENNGWTFSPQNVIKSGFALTGQNHLRLKKAEKFEKSFMPKNKEEIFIAAAWMRSNLLKIGEPTESFKALISFSSDDSNFTELFGILADVKSRNGEWFYVEVSVDIPNAIRTSYEDYRSEHPENPQFDAVDFKLTLTATGIENSQLDIDHIAFYPSPHRLDVNVYNNNRDVTEIIHNEGQISKIYYDSMTFREIGRTKKNGQLEQFLIRSEGEKNSPKIITRFNLSSGFYENFDKILFTNRWKMSKAKNWKVFPSELIYIGKDSDGKIEVRDTKMMDEKSAALRCEIALDSQKKSKFEVKFKTDSIKFVANAGSQANLMVNERSITKIPKQFELAIFKYQKRTIVWIDGIIKFDEVLSDTWKGFSFNFHGKMSIKNMFILNNPKVEVFYHNSFDQKQQVIKLESESSAIVTQYIYDKFGREIVKTKPTKIIKSSSEPLLKFHDNFIKTFDPESGEISGDVVTLNPFDDGFPYHQTIFYKNPLNEKQKVGQPGKDYSLQSNFATSYDKNFDFPFINAYFPDSEGFTKHVENLANGSKRALVFDKKGNKVARYVRVPNFDDLLITYEYDDDGRVVKTLSPEYHEAAKTVLKINEIWKSGDAHLTTDEKELQNKLGIHFKYDRNGNVIEKRTPDVGRQVFLYNSMNLLKFSITYNADPKDGQTIYYNYDSSGLLTETGHIIRPVSVEYLKKFVDSNFHTEAIEFQKIQFNEGKFKTIETINHDTTVLEEIQFDENEEDKIVSRKMTVPALTESLQTSFNLQRKYIGDNVEVMTYPTTDGGDILKVKNTYNAVGQLIGIGTVEKPFCFAKFTYDANGQPTNEVHELNNLNRNYSYNSPGYMSKIDDEFLSEDISYINGGYGQLGYGDGIVMKTAYNAKWSDEYFKRVDKDKLDESNEDNGRVDYENGVFEDEENVNDGNSNLRRRKRGIRKKIKSFDKLESDLNFDKENSNKSSNFKVKKENGTRFIRNKQDVSKPFDKLENILCKFQGFTSNSSDPMKSYSNDKDQPGSRSTVLSNGLLTTFESKVVDKYDGSVTTLDSDTRYKRSSNSPQNNESLSSKSRQIKINEIISNPDDDFCISALKTSNYISENSFRFSKLLNTNDDDNLPLKCHDSKIYDEISAKHQVPSYYGHRYMYGTHRELVKAKYFSTKDEEQVDPLQMSTFHDKIPGIRLFKSHNIFNILRDGHFIAVDQRRDEKKSSISTRGTTSLIRDADLVKLLQNLNKNEDYDFMELLLVVKQLILHTIETKKILKQNEFEKIFLNWKSAGSGTFRAQLNKYKIQAKKLFDGLVQQKLLPTSQSTLINPINKKLVDDLKNYSNPQIIDVVGVLSKAFKYELLTTAFDTASYEIDANGNHKRFTTGFESVKLDYHENTSKLKSLNLKGQQYTVDHDGYGNMTSAPHKGVKKMIYHPVSRRVMEVLMTNGGSVKFHYNAQGERILKQVYDSKYEITKEILYIRDEDGNVLMDRVMNFDQVAKTCFEVVTHYIYGPRGMIGFIRDDKFHSLFTDHSGSVRLIIRDGKVVASYDYLPYGEMMRKFVSDDAADIRYLYHGKELDDEFDTYNFHARFYDPTIGRFLQTDPQSQYFSPYKFSGNSPVSFIDPTGEVAFLVAVAFGFAGAYFNMAAYNKSFNPADWDWRDMGTYVNGVIGFLTGYALPGGVVASVKAFGFIAAPAIMSLTAYVSVAATNKSWDPSRWKFDDPETYSALFNGISAGASAINGVKSFHSYAKTLSLGGKIKLFAFASVTAGGAFYMTGLAVNSGNTKFWEWDYSKPETIKAIMDGFMLGVNISTSAAEISKDFKNFRKNPKATKEFFKNLTPSKIKNLKTIFADKNHPLYKFLGSLVVGYVMASLENNNFNPTNWDWKSAGTLSAGLNGIVSGKNMVKSMSSLTKAKIKAKISSEWKQVTGARQFVKAQYTRVKFNIIKLRTRGIERFRRYQAKYGRPTLEYRAVMRNRVARLDQIINNEARTVRRSIVRGTQVTFDRIISMLSPCTAVRRRRALPGAGVCRVISTRWGGLKNRLSRRDMGAVFENTAIVTNVPSTFSGMYGYTSLIGPDDDQTFVNPDDSGGIIITDEPSEGSQPGLHLANETKIDIDLGNRQRRQVDKVSIIVTDQTPGTTIYTRENAGKLEIYHQHQESELKIALTADKDGKMAFYDTKKGLKIDELADVKVFRLFDGKNEEIRKSKGVFEIPDDKIVKFITNGEFKVLKSIHGTLISNIVAKNKQIRHKNAENLLKNLPNYIKNCYTCKAIHWEDHFPAGVIDTAYNLNIDKPLKVTAVIYKDNQNNWKLASQLVQFNKGKPEIAEIRPKPKIFDIKLSEATPKRRRRSTPKNMELLSENLKISTTKFYLVDNSTQNFNNPTPSVLALGDFWLNATDFNSNLTLAYAFLKKWTNETLFSTNEGNMPKITDIEFEIFANDLTNEFAENLFELSIKCGISTVMRDILDDLNLPKISNEVKRKVEKNSIEEISKYLMREILEKNERKIVGKSSKKQFEKLKKLMAVYLEELTDDMTERNDKLWNL